ncbi:MAG: diguanylate cyclase [Gammaproteobacteria bacterium]|nr:diguanylate cyclase [Gammaproteobacteria bacterium]
MKSHFAQTASRYSVAIEQEMAVALETLHIIKGLYDGSKHVDADEFAEATSDIYRRHPEIISISWFLGADGITQFPELEYLERNAKGPGTDVIVASLRDISASYFSKATDSGAPVLVENIDTAKGPSNGLHVILPVYKPAMPKTFTERRDSLLGYIVGSFSLDYLLHGAIAKSMEEHVSYSVYAAHHGTNNAQHAGKRLYEKRPQQIPELQELSATDIVMVGDRNWFIQIEATPSYSVRLRSALPALVGLSLLALLAAFYWMMRVSDRTAREIGQQVVERTRALNLANQRLQQVARTDYLTDLPNRRSFDEALEIAIESGCPVGLVLIDVDFFKAYNDFYGHQAGDECLQRVANALRGVTRSLSGVAVGRYGGEEFAVLVTEKYKLPKLAEALREAVAALAIPHKDSTISDVVTISLGVLEQVTPDTREGFAQVAAELLQEADEALYHAKAAGRNRSFVVGAEKPANDSKSFVSKFAT